MWGKSVGTWIWSIFDIRIYGYRQSLVFSRMCIDAIVEETNLDRLQMELSFLRMKASLETNFNGLVLRKDERVAMKGSALPP